MSRKGQKNPGSQARQERQGERRMAAGQFGLMEEVEEAATEVVKSAVVLSV